MGLRRVAISSFRSKNFICLPKITTAVSATTISICKDTLFISHLRNIIPNSMPLFNVDSEKSHDLSLFHVLKQIIAAINRPSLFALRVVYPQDDKL